MIHYITTQGLHDAWVGNELRVVGRAGIPFTLHAMRRPERAFFRSEWAAALDRATRFLYPLPVIDVAVSLLAAPILFRGRFFAALGNALFGERESFAKRVRAFGHFLVACWWARQLRGEPVSHIHSQWIHSCGTIGMYGAWLLDVPFSFTGHGTDVFRGRVALRDKIRRAKFIACISTFHRDLYLAEGADPERLELVYCGIDMQLFRPSDRPSTARSRPVILSAGRLVEKKGFAFLLEACRRLVDRGIDFSCEIAGSGELEPLLRERIVALGLSDRVRVSGQALQQEDIPAFIARGDVFCLACVRARDGDVDGLPQLLMEAMACGVPVISTRISGIPDLVRDGETGLLCEPERADELADRLERLLRDRAVAERLAGAGRELVCKQFDIATSLEPLIARFRAAGQRVPGPDGS